MRVLFLAALFSVISLSVRAQDTGIMRSDSLLKVDGETFLVHTVGPRQTLFSIAKTYGITLSRLVMSNPGVLEGIQPGHHLRVPKQFVDETLAQKAPKGLRADGEFILYEVPARMTLYSIARDHNTTVTALVEANPELKDGLKVGSEIRIPVQRSVAVDTVVGIAELRERRPLPTRMPDLTPAIVARDTSSVFHVSLLLPFFLAENDSLLHSEDLTKPEVFVRSQMALGFYGGLLVALDSVRATGLDVRLQVFDTGNSEKKVQQLIAKGKLKDADLIIGPFYSGTFEVVSNYAYAQCIPIISPTIQGERVVENPYAFKMIPTEERMMAAIGRYLSKLRGPNNLVLHYGKPNEQVLLWRFRKGLGSGTAGRPPMFPAVDVSKGLKDSVFYRLSPESPNHLMVITADEAKVASLVRSLSRWAEDADITLYGLSDWPKFRNVEMDYYDKLKLHVPAPFITDYEDETVQRFILTYRNRYATDPTTFALRGYDLGIHFLRALPGLRSEGVAYMLKVKDRGLQTDFDWVTEEGKGFENSTPRIVDYTGLNLTFERP